jgi:hypothetical protein
MNNNPIKYNTNYPYIFNTIKFKEPGKDITEAAFGKH